MTGLVSGLDTESLVAQLSEAYQTKVDNVEKEKTKLEWKKEAWASLNTKLMDFYKGALSTFKSLSTYNAKSVAGSLSGVKITAGSAAAIGTHKVQVTQTASSQMLTGKKLNDATYTATSYENADTSMKLSELKDSSGHDIGASLSGASFTVGTGENAKEVIVSVGMDATVQDALDNINSQLEGTGVEATFKDGKISLTNVSATETTETVDGKETTTYSGGESIVITTDDELSAKVFGLKQNEEVALASKAEDANASSTSSTEGFYKEIETTGSSVTGSTKLTDLGIAEGTVIKVNGKEITVSATMTMSGLATEMANSGINANYDEKQGRFYLSSKASGVENAFEVEADDATLAALGLDLKEGDVGYIAAQDAKVVYNGVEYTQSSNSFSINGLTIDVTSVGEEQTFSVSNDVDGIYDKVKEFVNSYNSLIEEMNTLYSADRVTDYEPLTDDEKESMSDDQIEKWESIIKKSLLRRDDTINSLLSTMRTVLNKQVSVTNADGTTTNYSLASFGIETGVYSENGKLHILGNSEDSDYADMEDKLKAALSANADAVAKTLSSIGNEMYSKFQTAMKSSELSSALTFYNDKQMDSDLEDYDDKIETLEEKLQAEEDKYYEQFSAMETAMAKLQAQQSYISQLFGG